MLIRVKGVYSKHKKLANGEVRTYHYHRASGARLQEPLGTPEFLAEVRRLDEGAKSPQPAARTVKHLINEYRASARFADLAKGTKSEYRRHLARIEFVLGPYAVKSVKRTHVEKFTQKFSDRPTTARAVHTVVVLLFSYAVDRLGWLDFNPLLGMKRNRCTVHHCRRVDIHAGRRSRSTAPTVTARPVWVGSAVPAGLSMPV